MNRSLHAPTQPESSKLMWGSTGCCGVHHPDGLSSHYSLQAASLNPAPRVDWVGRKDVASGDGGASECLGPAPRPTCCHVLSVTSSRVRPQVIRRLEVVCTRSLSQAGQERRRQRDWVQ